jgi:hypothetical protein
VSTELKPSEVLDKAADYIDEHGWCQKAMVDNDGRVCAIGAIRAAVCMEEGVMMPWVSTGHQALTAATHLAEAAYDGLDYWNDAEGRTQFDVTNLLRKAAEAERAAGR